MVRNELKSKSNLLCLNLKKCHFRLRLRLRQRLRIELLFAASHYGTRRYQEFLSNWKHSPVWYQTPKNTRNTKFKLKSQKMCNVFTLGTVFTSIEIALYALSLIYCAIKFGFILPIIIPLIIGIVCFVLELIGLKKKHFGLTIFSVVFRSIQVLFWLVKAIVYVIVMQSYEYFNENEKFVVVLFL